ncbi:hypothetical protein HCR_01620 [Hydrogenimonas cancrithermarum]|uniref:Cytochrome c domain-containing protein n=1 Tax=Hydrogenimonas cancrithermarum TaxID=2993563 RepID=A0ABN6WT59_9BACT|nr:hypothetical protein HCR_01620 [Hydrogenimonas cancrithermarum]
MEDEKRYLKTLESIMKKIDKKHLTEMGRALYIRKCAFCHGKDGRGRNGFAADLTRRISQESAKYTIQNGGHNFKKSFPGSMPPMVPEPSRAEVIADYVAKGFPNGHPGKTIFVKAYCARCHGTDGRGIRFRAPNIRHFDTSTIAAVLRNGKKGVIGRMPAYTHFSASQVTMLSYFIMTLSERPAVKIRKITTDR